MATLIVRDTAPTVSNPCYRHVSYNNGYNRCLIRDYDTGFVLPNCVGYAWGRFLEANNLTDCRLSTGNASIWMDTNDGYARGNVPKIGAIGCYKGGSYGGAGHVLFVENINPDGTILCSESNYGGGIFQMRTLAPSAELGYGLIFQGFIYSPTDFDGASGDPIPVDPDPPIAQRIRFKWWLSAKLLRERKD